MWRDYEAFVAELGAKFPHEREGIRRFYDECWRVFDSLNRCGAPTAPRLEPRILNIVAGRWGGLGLWSGALQPCPQRGLEPKSLCSNAPVCRSQRGHSRV